jgi:hypothetical protein
MRVVFLIVLMVISIWAKQGLYKMSDCYGRTKYVGFDPDTIVSVEPAKCTDKNGIKVFRVIVKTSGYRPYMMNENELDAITNTDEIIKRDMKAQEMKTFRKGLMLE